MSLLQMSASGAVLILMIGLFRAAALYKLPKRFFLALWEGVFLRLLTPFSVPSVFSVYALINGGRPAAGLSGTSGDGITPAAQGNGLLPADIPLSIPIRPAVWLAGLLLFAAFFAFSYLYALREFRTALPFRSRAAERWLGQHPLRRRVSVRQSDRVSAPLTYGIFHPVILLPKGMDWDHAELLDYVFAHEYAHICRFDGAVKLIATAVLCIHWFNPMVWVMYILFNRDIELACDERVIRQYGEVSRSAYARALIGMEAKKSGLLPFGSNFSKNAIEERIRAMMRTKKTAAGIIAGGLAILLVTAVLFATSVSAPEPDSLKQLENSVAYQDGTVQFTIPGYEDTWDIQLYGCIDTDGFGGMNVHFLEENAGGLWERGKTYFEVSSNGSISEDVVLYFDAGNGQEAISIDLLDLPPADLE